MADSEPAIMEFEFIRFHPQPFENKPLKRFYLFAFIRLDTVQSVRLWGKNRGKRFGGSIGGSEALGAYGGKG